MKTHSDERGDIVKIFDDVSFIRTFAGARRANHYHKTTGHWCYLTKGLVVYWERPVGSSEKPTHRAYAPWNSSGRGR